MSFNRENVTWQSKDGTWSLGFYAVEYVGDDEEWDVEYDFTRFGHVTTGHATEQAAQDSWHGANPGGSSIYPYRRNAKKCQQFDRMATAVKTR